MNETTQAAVVPEWTLGWRMQRALAHAGITIEEMASELGVSRSTVSRWVNDHGADPRIGYLKLWAMRCGVPLEWLLDGGVRTP
jgi:transcriptional regulator with XRE-family HTH domain